MPQTASRTMETMMTPVILCRWNCPKNNHPRIPIINPSMPIIDPIAIKNSIASPTASK
ncbi:MAG: hypothetical protein ACFFDH_14300 [Promethearchaeota archaeon]